MEYWSNGRKVDIFFQHSNTPSLQYSTIAILKGFGQPWINSLLDSSF
jgi:hypothetical protein